MIDLIDLRLHLFHYRLGIRFDLTLYSPHVASGMVWATVSTHPWRPGGVFLFLRLWLVGIGLTLEV